MLTVTDGAGVKTTYEYDALHRKVHQYDQLAHHWYWAYDKSGNLTRQTDANGKVTQYGYDQLNRLHTVTDADNHVTMYTYDLVGNLTQITDAAGKAIARKSYDNVNRLIRREDGLTNAYEYSYDLAGNPISVKDAKNRTATMVYDNENRLSETHYPDATQVTRGYDANGNMITLVDPTGTTTYIYDELDRLASTTDSFGKQVLYGHDMAGNRSSLTYPADSTNPARTVTYGYDDANRLDTITDWKSRVTHYTLDGAGKMTQVVYPNAMRELRLYDGAGRLRRLSYQKSDATPLIRYVYTRDPQGNPTSINETGTLQPDLAAMVGDVHFTYDADDRLTGTNQPAVFQYDNNGNQVSRTVGGTLTTFTFDDRNLLASQAAGASTVQHAYDGLGDRIARIDNGTATRYVLDRGRSLSHVLCETDGPGNIIAYYIHGPQIIGRVGANGSQRYYLTDELGSVAVLVDENQTITDRYAYTPFGVAAGREGDTTNPFTYVGGLGVMIEADGLYFMRARFYDAAIGRFLAKDTVPGDPLMPLSANRYIYAMGNPALLTDPSGKSVAYVGIGGGGTATAGGGMYGSGELRLGVSTDAYLQAYLTTMAPPRTLNEAIARELGDALIGAMAASPGLGSTVLLVRPLLHVAPDDMGAYFSGSSGIVAGGEVGPEAHVAFGVSPARDIRHTEGGAYVGSVGGAVLGGGSLSTTRSLSSGEWGAGLSAKVMGGGGAGVRLGLSASTRAITLGDAIRWAEALLRRAAPMNVPYSFQTDVQSVSITVKQ